MKTNIKTIYNKIYTILSNLQPIRKLSIVLLSISTITLSSIIYAQTINNKHGAQGTQWAYNMDMSFNDRFETITHNGVSVYRDKLTGLKWEEYSFPAMSYQSARNHCFRKGNKHRLPTIYELRTLMSLNTKNSNHAYSIHPGINKASLWSSTCRNNYCREAWIFNPKDNIITIDYTNDENRVLCLLD